MFASLSGQPLAKRTKLAKNTYDAVVARWDELGLPGKPPTINVFEEDKFPDSIT